MRTYQLPGLQSMSEFVQNGDCGEDAYLMAMHAVAPGRFPLTWGGLLAVDHDEESHGYAAANGAQTIYQMADYLARIGVPHHVYGWDATQNTGGAPFTLDALHAQLKAFAVPLDNPGALPTPPPVIVETSTAGAGFPQDEGAVQFHFATFGGMSIPETTAETGGYWRVDGDAVQTNAASGAASPAILTQWAEIVAAGIIAYITIDGLPPQLVAGEVAAMAWTQQSDGTGRDEHGHTCGTGFMGEIAAKGINADGLMSETYYAAHFSFLPLADGQVLTYDPTYGVTHNGAAALQNVWEQLQAAQAELTQLKQAAAGDDESKELSPANVAAFRLTLSAQATQARQLAMELTAALNSLPSGI